MTTEDKKPLSKTDIFAAIAESTSLSKKDVQAVFTALNDLISKQVGKKGPGVFAVPGLLKIQVVRKPATKATQRANPFKPGEMMVVKAKPARNTVKIRALKSLKDMV
ncbi:histone family protein DNA-binding protein [Planctopirus limnophila DSM 3776]|jgi:nucleoid DNA-binding protein|uniref:Histone family protein DNA-binding protein n=3 Tax=Planctopirus TaxID=1649480 RepID=D5SMI7_PLAL2|nr:MULTISPECIES: HU family DNA-binding protein [Planctopirus]ADG65907.1 histone family protein DNA-binding protein [Planctopirus limnophila DSM 3776]ODA34998.1 DNA-binding protein [Planctopirus hydrillae]QDV28956.1 Bacterial DNA-binding protein [Planctopirus ephydatiae]